VPWSSKRVLHENMDLIERLRERLEEE